MQPPSDQSPANPNPRRWRRRPLLVVPLAFVVAAVLLVGWAVRHHARQERALADLTQLGGSATVSVSLPAWTARLDGWLPSKFVDVLGKARTDVSLDARTVDEALAAVGRLDAVERLEAPGATDAGLAALAGRRSYSPFRTA